MIFPSGRLKMNAIKNPDPPPQKPDAAPSPRPPPSNHMEHMRRRPAACSRRHAYISPSQS